MSVNQAGRWSGADYAVGTGRLAPATAVLPFWGALVVAAASGPILDAGFPDRGVWPLTLVGIALVLLTLIGRGAVPALVIGFVAGLSFYLVHIEWASLFLGPIPMTALSVLESLFFSLGALAITLAYRWVALAWPRVPGRMFLLPAVVAGLWTAREAWASVWPYGGFAWGRVALSQSEGPFAPLFSWLGVSGVSFAMVFIVALAIETVRLARAVPLGGLSSRGAPGGLGRAAIGVGTATLMLIVPAFPVVVDGSIRVAAVQGNGKAGYFDTRERGDLLQAQLDATMPLLETKQDLDVVLWPEGGTDVDPLTNSYAAGVMDFVASEAGAPVITGAITERDGLYFNTSMLWKAGEGAVDLYDKKHPVPFGEYVPDREFWLPFSPELIGLIGRQYTPGTTDAVFDVDGIIAGINICFDISDDQLMTESVEQGAQVIFAQTNNADFGRTDESVQQLAIARIRALELGRSVVNISTVGTSAIILADGSTLDELEWYTSGSMVANVPTSSSVTAAVALGRQLEWLVSCFAIGSLLLAAWTTRRARRG